MNDSLLSQEEINALVGKEDERDISELELSSIEKDLLLEMGNIAISKGISNLSKYLKKEVDVTNPAIKKIEGPMNWEETDVFVIEYEEGIKGYTYLLLDKEDKQAVEDGINSIEENTDVAEVFDNMIYSSIESISKMVERDIKVKKLYLLQDDKDLVLNSLLHNYKVYADYHINEFIDFRIELIFRNEDINNLSESILNERKDKEELDKKVTVKEEKRQEEVGTMELNKESLDSGSEKVEVKKPVFPTLEEDEDMGTGLTRNLDLIMDVPLEFSVVLGRSKKSIREILSFSNGSIVELDKLADEALEVYVNGKLIANGEVVVINEKFGIRITNILTKEERVQHLG